MKKKIELKNSISIPMHPGIIYILELSTFEDDFLVGLHIKEVKRQRRGRGGTDKQPLFDKQPLIHGEELTVLTYLLTPRFNVREAII